MSKARIGTFDDLLRITEEPLRPIAQALRELVFEIDSNAFEVVRPGDRAATCGVGSLGSDVDSSNRVSSLRGLQRLLHGRLSASRRTCRAGSP